MYGWVKTFADGSKEIGTDRDVQRRKASWSRGRLTHMIGAEVHHGNKVLSIHGPGEYWQSDDYDISTTSMRPVLAVRRLSYQLTCGDVLYFGEGENHLVVGIETARKAPNRLFTVDEEMAGKWLTLEYDVHRDEISWKIREERA